MSRNNHNPVVGAGRRPFFIKKCNDANSVIANPSEAFLFFKLAVDCDSELDVLDCLMLENGMPSKIFCSVLFAFHFLFS
jgi:hypothetical protein